MTDTNPATLRHTPKDGRGEHITRRKAGRMPLAVRVCGQHTLPMAERLLRETDGAAELAGSEMHGVYTLSKCC